MCEIADFLKRHWRLRDISCSRPHKQEPHDLPNIFAEEFREALGCTDSSRSAAPLSRPRYRYL
jgi:hypothetical protein